MKKGVSLHKQRSLQGCKIRASFRQEHTFSFKSGSRILPDEGREKYVTILS